MKKIVLWALLGSWLAAMALAGCGQTGPLYLPKSENTTKQLESEQAAQVKSLAKPQGSMATSGSTLAAPTKSLAAPEKSANPNP